MHVERLMLINLRNMVDGDRRLLIVWVDSIRYTIKQQKIDNNSESKCYLLRSMFGPQVQGQYKHQAYPC